ncbi:MAG: acetylornithine deacetylase [Gammaproteobacteria bacterium]|nr:acetylornithine deacetylase [Gammaproteobacteria bacterium]
MSTPRQETLDLVRTLIGFDTVSRNPNLGLIEWTRDYLRRLGVEARLTHDPDGTKANLFATLGEERSGGLVLCGHTDVVPVDGQPWETDPFRAELRGDRIYGRGSCDMKSFIACVLAAVPRFLQSGLTQPLHLAFTYDEEVGSVGVTSMIHDLRRIGLQPAGCIVGEPTSMQVMTGHKGIRMYRCRVRGLEAHSSLAPYAVNAIEYAAELVTFVRELAAEAQASGPRDETYSVPFTTLQTGMIAGGTAPNIVPRDCEFRFDLRYLPDTDADGIFSRVQTFAEDKLVPRMRAVAAQTGIEFDLVAEAPALEIRDEHPLARLAARLTGNEVTGRVGFATDGGHFHDAGVPTVVVGPGSIEQAHKPNEFITLDQIARCEEFLMRLNAALQKEPAV